MEEQRVKARSARKVSNYMGADVTVYESIDPSITSEFVGYDNTECDGKILVLTTDTEIVQALAEGDCGTIITDKTPFYATSGGQAADTGVIKTESAEFEVQDTIKLLGGKIGHVGKVTKGMFAVDETVKMCIDVEKRLASGKNHSATHLLQKALREVLGTHVEQHGSDVNPERLRFDFSHFSAMTTEEIAKVEKIVNEKIQEGLPVVTEIMDIEDAKKTGAMALFGEKYGDKVRVVKMGNYSTELCGGTHVKNTASITAFKILSESGIAAGVRRIEALTSNAVFEYYNNLENILNSAAKALKTNVSDVVDKIAHLNADLKKLQSENESLKAKAASDALGDVMDKVTEVKGVKLLAVYVPDVDGNGIRDLGDKLKSQLGEGVVVLASSKDGKVSLLSMATDAAMKAGAHAGNLIKEIASVVGGGGGGRPNMAQAGGKNPDGINDALAKAKEVLESQLG